MAGDRCVCVCGMSMPSKLQGLVKFETKAFVLWDCQKRDMCLVGWRPSQFMGWNRLRENWVFPWVYLSGCI